MVEKHNEKKKVIDTTSGSMSYNRFDMQISQVLHMAIELYDNLDYLFILDYYDDITLFEDEYNPNIVSYYQMKTNGEYIQFNTALSEEWIVKLYAQLEKSEWEVKELGLITNCPVHITIRKVESSTGKQQSYVSDGAHRPFTDFKPETIKRIKEDIAEKQGISVNDVDISKFFHIRTTLTLERHRDIVNQELGEFLNKRYPGITVDSVKAVYSSILEILSRRQSIEDIASTESFEKVSFRKGFAKSEFKKVIERSILLSLPSIADVMSFFQEEELVDVCKAFSLITTDKIKEDLVFEKMLIEVSNLMEKIEICEEELAVEYVKRIAAVFRKESKKLSAIRVGMYIEVLAACVYLTDVRLMT